MHISIELLDQTSIPASESVASGKRTQDRPRPYIIFSHMQWYTSRVYTVQCLADYLADQWQCLDELVRLLGTYIAARHSLIQRHSSPVSYSRNLHALQGWPYSSKDSIALAC